MRLDITYLSSASHIRDEDRQALGPIEDVLIVGYPKGLWDRHNNRPIVRKGLTATDIRLDYNGEPIFLIDAASFRGSSGSPVFLHTAPFRSTPTGTTIAPQVFGFAGVLFARPVRNEVGEMVISQIPVLESDPEEADRLIHLGCVVRAEKLLDLDLIIRSKAKPIDKQ